MIGASHIKYIHMEREQEAGTRKWAAQKGNQHEAAPCRGHAWQAGQGSTHGRNCSDCSQAISLPEGLDVKVLLADKGYDSNAILEYTQERGITAVTPLKRNRKV